jgi:hypothetical protein
MADDVLEAVKAMDFQEFLEPLNDSLKGTRPHSTASHPTTTSPSLPPPRLLI